MAARPWVLGFSASHNGAVCLLHGSELVVAIQEERLSGQKRARIDRLEESLAFQYCLQTAGIEAHQLDAVVGCYFAGDFMRGQWRADARWKGTFEWIPHHLGHAYGAYATSGFSDAAVLIIDGQGGLEKYQPDSERVNVLYAEVPGLAPDRRAEIMSLYRFDEHRVELVEKHYGTWLVDVKELAQRGRLPRYGSLGGMYSSVTAQIFDNVMDPGKVMGLAAFGRATIPPETFFHIAPDGHFVFNDAICHRPAHRERWPQHQAEYQDLATSVQEALEVGVMHMAQRAAKLTGSKALTYAGGVALNSVANERIIRSKWFERFFVMPAAEDSGPAIGAAYYGLRSLGGAWPRKRSRVDAPGRSYTSVEIHQAVTETPHVEVVPTPDVLDHAVDLLVDGKIIGWFQEGAELGPRALGQRSIIADPRRNDVKEILNARVKHREAFRPFAPVILEEHVADWFEVDAVDDVTPFMLRAPPFRSERRAQVPGAVHHDGTGRLQTVGPNGATRYRALLERFYARTGVPVLINTSFNVMSEPIVETPADALWCLLYTELDACFLEDVVVRRARSFQSLLHLVPRLTLTSLRLEIAQQGALSTSLEPGDRITGVCRRPWGDLRFEVPDGWHSLLELIDGRRTGNEIRAELATQSHTLSEAKPLAAALRVLRRTGAIAFSAAAPVSP